jgi:tetratricopeptide (TPR) repeat protein
LAEPPLKRALQIHENTFGAKHFVVAATIRDLALLYDMQGQFASSDPLVARALPIDVNALTRGAYDPTAEPFYKQSLAIREKATGPDAAEVATALNNLAELYRAGENYASAEPLYKRALAIREKRLGLDHADVGETLTKYAALLRKTNRAAEAEAMERRAKEIREKHQRP